jgi:tetratricopeptide (TPR) repeat protein
MVIKDQLLSLLSSGWMSLEEITKKLNYQEKNAIQFIANNLQGLERKSEIISEEFVGKKYWTTYWDFINGYSHEIKKYKIILSEEPKNEDALFNLAKTYFYDGNFGQALFTMLKLKTINDNYPYQQYLSMIYTGIGHKKYKEKDYSSAVEYLQKATSLFKNSISWERLGKVFRETGKLNQAITAFEESISIDDIQFDSYYELGLIYYERDEFKLAERNFRAAIEFSGVEDFYNGIQIPLWHRFISTKKKLGTELEAIELLEIGLGTTSDFGMELDYWYYLSSVYKENNLFERGIRVFEENLELNKSFGDREKNSIKKLKISLELEFKKLKTIEALNFFKSASTSCELADIIGFFKRKNISIILEKSDLKYLLVSMVNAKELDIRMIDEKISFLSENPINLDKPKGIEIEELILRNYVGVLFDRLIYNPKIRKVKINNFVEELQRYTSNSSLAQKVIVDNEVKRLIKSNERFKKPKWQKIGEEILKILVPTLLG